MGWGTNGINHSSEYNGYLSSVFGKHSVVPSIHFALMIHNRE